jgi:hypothetical protein
MSAQLVKKFKRADPSRAELTMNRASQRATSISSSPIGFIIVHDKIIVFKWNMERQPETTLLLNDGMGRP